MNAGEHESRRRPENKKLVYIPLLSSSAAANDDMDSIPGELTVPSASRKPEALIIFAHGGGSGRDSPRNQHVAQVLNRNGFATLLSDLLTLEEQESDIKSQKIIGKYPGIVLNKFNIPLLSDRLSATTRWITNNVSEVKDLPIGYFGSSTGGCGSLRGGDICSTIR
jgi:dienelactone hydrolase